MQKNCISENVTFCNVLSLLIESATRYRSYYVDRSKICDLEIERDNLGNTEPGCLTGYYVGIIYFHMQADNRLFAVKKRPGGAF